jgi:hypothetical protein
VLPADTEVVVDHARAAGDAISDPSDPAEPLGVDVDELTGQLDHPQNPDRRYKIPACPQKARRRTTVFVVVGICGGAQAVEAARRRSGSVAGAPTGSGL